MKIVFKGQKHYQIFRLLGDGTTVVDCSVSNNADRVETQYRYFMILVPTGGLKSGNTIQFSKLHFHYGTNVNDCYPWCADMINFKGITDSVGVIKASGSIGSSGEDLQNGLLGVGNTSQGSDEVEDQPGVYRAYGKMCYTGIFSSGTVSVDGTVYACFACDIDKQQTGQRIDIQTYNRWCWHAANDTYPSGSRNMLSFSLYMSNDRSTWQLVDKAENITPLNPANYKLIYDNAIYPHYTVKDGKKIYTMIKLDI